MGPNETPADSPAQPDSLQTAGAMLMVVSAASAPGGMVIDVPA